MPRDEAHSTSLIDEISAIEQKDVAAFVQDCMKTRRLSRIVRELNQVALSQGNPRRGDALAALSHIGFI